RPKRQPLPATTTPMVERRQVLVLLFLSGLLGIGYEVLAVLAISQVLHNTIYTFALSLAVYLGGTAIDAALHGRLSARLDYRKMLGNLLCALSATCLLGTLAMGAAPRTVSLCGRLVGEGFWGGLLGEVAVAISALLVPTIAMGALFTHLCTGLRTASSGIG